MAVGYRRRSQLDKVTTFGHFVSWFFFHHFVILSTKSAQAFSYIHKDKFVSTLRLHPQQSDHTLFPLESTMHFSTLLVFSAAAFSTAGFARPTGSGNVANTKREITINHTSPQSGTSTSHVIDPSSLSPELKKAIEGSHININLIADKRDTTVPSPDGTGINNSTINLTVIGSKAKRSVIPKKRSVVINSKKSLLIKKTSTTSSEKKEKEHHNIHIDASSSSPNGTGGGIHNSTVNINLHGVRRSPAPKMKVGDNSILLTNPTTTDEVTGEKKAGIDGSVVNINVLPGKEKRTSQTKEIGDHSILIDATGTSSSSSSSTTAAEQHAEAGDHSAVVSSAINDSTVNMTVVSPKEDDDDVEAAVKLVAKRGEQLSSSTTGGDFMVRTRSRLSRRSSESSTSTSSSHLSRRLEREHVKRAFGIPIDSSVVLADA